MKYKKHTTESIKKDLALIGYELLNNYKNIRIKIKVKCNKGHVYNVLYCGFKNGSRCPYCSGLAKLKNEDVKKEIEKEGFKLLSEYINARTKLKIQCNKGHINKILLGSFRKIKNKCKYCRLCNINNITRNGSGRTGTYTSMNVSLYNTYADRINWCEEVRRNKEDKNILEVKCTYCGKWYIPTAKSINHRINALYGDNNKENRLYCSVSCKQECPIYLKKKYSAEETNTKRNSREVQPELRQLVFERDDWTCKKCGSKKSLHCHHITGVELNPIESADIDNCITLCKKCHREIHKQNGCSMRRKECK